MSNAPNFPEDPTERFTGLANSYAQFRPTYPPELFDMLAEKTHLTAGSIVADIGCGTGISSRLMADRGWQVIGIEPNQEMLEKARQTSGDGVQYRFARAEETSLGDGSVHVVVCAQAFSLVRCGEIARGVPPNSASGRMGRAHLERTGYQRQRNRSLLTHHHQPSRGGNPRGASATSGNPAVAISLLRRDGDSPLCQRAVDGPIPNDRASFLRVLRSHGPRRSSAVGRRAARGLRPIRPGGSIQTRLPDKSLPCPQSDANEWLVARSRTRTGTRCQQQMVDGVAIKKQDAWSQQ